MLDPEDIPIEEEPPIEQPDIGPICGTCEKPMPDFTIDEEGVCSTCRVNEARALAVVSIEDMRAGKKAEITAWRNDRDGGGAPTPLGIMDSDPVSILKITGAVQMAQVATMASEPFSILWTMKDNSSVEHDASQMITAGMAVGQFIANNHATSVTLKALADIAEDEAALAAIVWPEEPAP